MQTLVVVAVQRAYVYYHKCLRVLGKKRLQHLGQLRVAVGDVCLSVFDGFENKLERRKTQVDRLALFKAFCHDSSCLRVLGAGEVDHDQVALKKFGLVPFSILESLHL